VNRSEVEAFIGKRVIVKFLYGNEHEKNRVYRYFIARIRRIEDDDEVVFAKEEWVDTKRDLGVEGEQLMVRRILYIAECPRSQQREVIVGAML